MTSSGGCVSVRVCCCHAASSIASSPSRVTAANNTRRFSAARQAWPWFSNAGSGDMSNLRLPLTTTVAAPAERNRCASVSLCASTSARLSTAGRINAARRCPLRRLLALRRAFASTIGTLR